MTKLFKGNIRILVKHLERVKSILFERDLTQRPGNGSALDKIDKAIGALYQIQLEPTSENIPVSSHYQIQPNFIDASLDELFRFNAMGDEYICSTMEAVVKCHGVKKIYDQYSTECYFRGEHQFGWELKSRLGRKLQIDWSENDASKVTVAEIDFLRKFQDRCANDQVLNRKVFGRHGLFLPLEHPGWWSLMQHYDELNGTRMIDITSSLYCALFFACVDWDGAVNESLDGKLYMFPYQPGTDKYDTLHNENRRHSRSQHQALATIETYFDVDSDSDWPCFRESPVRNDRALSQDGYFVWQARFDNPLKTVQVFPFRVHRAFKNSILKELSAMGYTRDRILANTRFNKDTD